MVSPHARRPVRGPHRRRLVPVGLVVVVYFVAGTLWVVGGVPVADIVTNATSVAPWIVTLALGLLYVAITALALSLSMRGRVERADARTDRADARTERAEARTDDAEARTKEARARTHMANARVHDRSRELAASRDHNRLQAAALSGTSTAVLVTDRDGIIEWVNEAFETLSGFESAEVVGGTPRLLSSGVQDEEFFQEMWKTILAGRVWRGDVVNRRSDGELYTVSQTVTPVVASNGRVQNFVATLEDITERVQAAQDLESSRLRLQSLVDHALDAIVLVDDDGHYVEVNPAFCALTGYSHEELLGMGPGDLAASNQQTADAATQFDDIAQIGTESGAWALRRRDGRVVETEYRAVSDVQPGVHLSVLRDVTDRNTMLRALAAAESDFRGLAENAGDIVAKLLVDDTGRVRVDYVNPAATVILGHAQERLQGEPELLLALFHEGGAVLDDVVDLRPTPAEPVRLATVQARRADGGLVWLEVHSAFTAPTTGPATIQVVARDVTARSEMMQALELTLRDQLEAAEQLRVLNAMKDTFLQSVSHELRTPLTAIMGFAHLLANPNHGLSPGNTRDFHVRILSNAERLQRLLDDLLDVDRFTRGHFEPSRMTTDLTALLERVAGDVDLGEHAIEFDLEPISMNLDALCIERLVSNLLRNVVRHTPPDSRIWIRARATNAGVEFTVDDDGPGIPEGERQRVIEPFQQGADAASSSQPGTGIGLTLVKTFAQHHGGDLVIGESAAGGARMVVTLAHAATGSTATAQAMSGG